MTPLNEPFIGDTALIWFKEPSFESRYRSPEFRLKSRLFSDR